jgi:branched-subunit amino acid transport protein
VAYPGGVVSSLAAILVMGASMYALRVAGLTAYGMRMPGSLERGLRFLPPALLAALVTSSLAGGQAWPTPERLVAAAAAGLVVWRTGRMWACILAGMLVYELWRVV